MKKHLPNAITCANLFSGCVGIVFAFNGDMMGAAFCVLASGIFDFFDGMVARLLNVKSTIGKELDSLADMVSFGLLPGVVLFQLLKQSDLSNSYIPYLGFIITVFSALRLAKFNIDERQTIDFIGLNTPMNTFFIISLPFIQSDYPAVINSGIFLIGIIALNSFLLVSEIRLFSLKFNGLSWQKDKIKFLFIIISAILISLLHFIAIPLVLILYLILSFIHFKKRL